MIPFIKNSNCKPIYSDKKQVIICLEMRGKRQRGPAKGITEEQEETFGVFIVLIVVMVSQVFTYICQNALSNCTLCAVYHISSIIQQSYLGRKGTGDYVIWPWPQNKMPSWGYISNNCLLLDIVFPWIRNETVIERKEESKQAVIQPCSVLSLIKAYFLFP